jgi:1-acyl-sn-glycerol-3-phosphate acyltransferase
VTNTQSMARMRMGRISHWILKYLLVGPWLRMWMRGKISNGRVLKEVSGAVIVSNHQSFIEHLLLPLHSPRPVQFWAKSDWWGDGLKGRLQGLFFTLTNQVPVERSGGAGANAAIEAAVLSVQSGNLFCIYPEGTRSRDGRVYRGRTGAVRVAALAGVPLIPSAVVGTGALQPIGKFWPRRGRFEMRFGDPIVLDFDAESMTELELRLATDRLMMEIVKLGSFEYVDEYARKR